MFAPFMVNAWVAGTVVAVVAGVVGFFVVLRGNAFLAHAIPHGAFAGAAGAVLLGVSPLLGLGVFAGVGAVTITLLTRRARGDAITALTLATMLGLGAMLLSRSDQYSAEVFALLFGQILGVSTLQLPPMLIIGAVCLVLLAATYRPLLLASALPDMARPRGVRPQLVSLLFAAILACATTMSVPIVGALLMFALLVGPPAAASHLARRPATAIPLGVAFALATVWGSISLAYVSDWPVGFFVTTIAAALYGVARLVAAWRRSHGAGPATSRPVPRGPRTGELKPVGSGSVQSSA